MPDFKAPFPWFGGKRRVAPIVWARFGDIKNYVEPFFGSGAVLLGRHDFDAGDPPLETVNDKDGFVSNFWRAVQAAPDEVAHYADWPVNENDLHARHAWLTERRAELVERLEGNPDYCDAKIAGWWVWGMACWIGGRFCSGEGPWRRVEVAPGDWRLRKLTSDGQGVQRQRVHLSGGQGVQRRLVHLGDGGQGIQRKRVHLSRSQGVKRKRVHLGDGQNAGTGEAGLLAWMEALSERLRRVRICSGDWARVCGRVPTVNHGLTGVFLDPPYSTEAGRDVDLYSTEDLSVAHDVREWAIANGDNPLLRIALCGYDTEHAMPDNWQVYRWFAQGGYANFGNGAGKTNKTREVIWFSPHCLTPPDQHNGHVSSLFDNRDDA